ncbi:hypothetical protein JCM10213_000845 [Rhodosporidiobolus nylandii]
MAQLVLKVICNDELRKLSLPLVPPPRYESLLAAVVQRFQLNRNNAEGVRLAYRDEEGDWVTISSDDELAESLASLPDGTKTLRLQLSVKEGEQATSNIGTASESEAGTASEVKQLEEEWTELQRSTGTVKQEQRETDQHEQGDPSSPTLVFSAGPSSSAVEDPASPSLPSSFPSLDSMDGMGDPEDEPLDAPPFATLPASLSSLFSRLPSHANSLSSHLQSLLTSQDSALSRLSALAASPASVLPGGVQPTDLSIAELARTLSALKTDVGQAVNEVMQGVRAEADAVRAEFEAFGGEVEREKKKWEREVEGAKAKAAAGSAEPSAAPPAAENVPEGPADAADPPSPEITTAPLAPPPLAPISSAASDDVSIGEPSVDLDPRLSSSAKREAKAARHAAREQRRAEKALRRLTKEAEKHQRREIARQKAEETQRELVKAREALEEIRSQARREAARIVSGEKKQGDAIPVHDDAARTATAPPLPPVMPGTLDLSTSQQYGSEQLAAPSVQPAGREGDIPGAFGRSSAPLKREDHSDDDMTALTSSEESRRRPTITSSDRSPRTSKLAVNKPPSTAARAQVVETRDVSDDDMPELCMDSPWKGHQQVKSAATAIPQPSTSSAASLTPAPSAPALPSRLPTFPDPSSSVLLTTFLLLARDTLGLDVDEPGTRRALIGIWTDAGGRGVQAMVERACDELLL